MKPSKALVHAQPRWGSRIICISSITATSSEMKQKHNINNIQLSLMRKLTNPLKNENGDSATRWENLWAVIVTSTFYRINPFPKQMFNKHNQLNPVKRKIGFCNTVRHRGENAPSSFYEASQCSKKTTRNGYMALWHLSSQQCKQHEPTPLCRQDSHISAHHQSPSHTEFPTGKHTLHKQPTTLVLLQ